MFGYFLFEMTQSNCLPHVYYTVSELSLIKDVNTLKNVNVKTIAYIDEGCAFDIEFKEGKVEKSNVFVKIDLTHMKESIQKMKQYIIYGVIYSVHESPFLLIKTATIFEENVENLFIYHCQSLRIRIRNPYYVNLSVVFPKSLKI